MLRFVFIGLLFAGTACSKTPSVADYLKDRELRSENSKECSGGNTSESCKNLVRAIDLLQRTAIFGMDSELLEHVESIEEVER